MKAKKVVTINNDVVEHITSFEGIHVYLKEVEYDEHIYYFVKGDDVIKSMTIQLDIFTNDNVKIRKGIIQNIRE